ncbi:MAG TPA: penicillin-binding protein 2 [Chthoniobacterales bacterium]
MRPLLSTLGCIAALLIPALSQGADPNTTPTAAEPAPAPALNPASTPPPIDPSSIAPTWETRTQAGTVTLDIPGPRGQITDRNGNPLAQTRVSYNLSLVFPTPLGFTDSEIVEFSQKTADAAKAVLGYAIPIDSTAAIRHYRNRGVIPFELARDLSPGDLAKLQQNLPQGLTLTPVYLRTYPQGQLAGHVIGYTGRQGRMQTGVLQNNERLWPETEGREGIEQAFNDQLTGRPGQMRLTFDKDGRKTSEKIIVPPEPGYNVITSIDENLQRLCETVLAKHCPRGAIVMIDVQTGDILALASWPVIDPNKFIPSISVEDFQKYNDDPAIPLLPRAYRSAYPPGSTFKVFVGLAALESGVIDPGDEFNCPPALTVGNTVMRNWKKSGAGSLNFVEALTQSCNTWFYQVGMKMGSPTLLDYSFKLGLGKRTGVPLSSEASGRIPTDDYMLKVHKRKLLKGDIANLSIGQGDILISPLQMAQAMVGVANGGTVFQPRLVQQVQTLDNKVVTAYGVRAKSIFEVRPDVMNNMRKAMVSVVSSGAGTAPLARVSGVQVAGKTGTAQWGPTKKQRTAAWFAGFAPADAPKYAFAAVYEGRPNDDSIHGGSHAAPLIGKVLREIYKEEKRQVKNNKSKAKANSEDEDVPQTSKDESD